MESYTISLSDFQSDNKSDLGNCPDAEDAQYFPCPMDSVKLDHNKVSIWLSSLPLSLAKHLGIHIA